MKTDYIGLWKARQGWYRSKVLKASDLKGLGNSVRIILRYNKYKDKDDNKPHFIALLADSVTADAISLEQESYSDDLIDAEERYSNLREKIEEIRRLAMRGQDACENIDGAYHYHSKIESMCDELLKEDE